MPTYTTRTEVVNALVEVIGMPRPYAKAAVDQQYNYDNDGDTQDLCRGDFEDLTIPHPVTSETLGMLRETWEDMLTTDEQGNICVDGEPMYDSHGDMI